MKAGLSIILSSLIFAAPALAQDIEAIGKREKPKRPKLICRAEKHTGTRVARPICASEAEWKAYDDEQANEAREITKYIDDGNRANTVVDQTKVPQMTPNGFQ